MENNRLLNSFVDYCHKHRDERFWQALRNWAGMNFLYASQMSKIFDGDEVDNYHYFMEEAQDTFYWDSKNPMIDEENEAIKRD